LGIVVTSFRPGADTVLGWWRLDHVQFTLDAWVRVWSQYNLAGGFWVTLQLAGLATIGSVLLTPAAAYAFQFLRFPFRRTLLIIIINAFVLPQQVIVIPLFTLWRQTGLIDNILSVLIPYVGLSFAWSIFLVKNFLEDFPRELVGEQDRWLRADHHLLLRRPAQYPLIDHRGRHPAVPVLLERTSHSTAVPEDRGAIAGDLRPDRRYL